jgi:hypothetical protein
MKAKKMKATLTEQLETYLQCPNCRNSKGICLTNIKEGDHFGPLSCTTCGNRVRGHVSGRGSVEIEYLPNGKEPACVLVQLDQKDVPLFLIVQEADPSKERVSDHNINLRHIIKVIRDESVVPMSNASHSKR